MQRFRTDIALSVDVERTCWDGDPPDGMRPEIIQIGLVEVDFDNLRLGREARMFVRPYLSTVSPYCTSITGITPEILKREGRPFAEVLRTIAKDWGPAHKSLLSWGSDWHGIEAECRENGYVNPFPAEGAINIGQAFTLLHGARSRLGLYAALEAVGIEPVGSRHDGLDDAKNAGLLALHHARELRAVRQAHAEGFEDSKIGLFR
jgi:inhibitor of KinA sporulation pathway (predicted exonuclease)